MSTRCQLQVVQVGIEWDEKITLYHHYDGYPENIVKLVEDTYKIWGSSWKAGRAGKVASFLCWKDPGQFEPEEGHELHNDIEFYYRLRVVNLRGGSMNEKPNWELDVFSEEKGWENPIKTIRIGQIALVAEEK